MNGAFTMIGVPVDSTGRPGGTELAPAALRALGLGDAIAGHDGGDLAVRIRAEERNPETGVVALADVCSTTVKVRRAVGEVLARNELPFLVGGCCSIVPGALAGVRDVRGRTSLAHLDGHLDLYDQTNSQLGEAADMPVTVAIGLGPPAWVDAAGGPSLSTSDVWIVGYRDREQSLLDGTLMPEDLDPPISCLTTEQVRSEGPARVGEMVARQLAGGMGNIWVHLDLDIVDPSYFFANDAPVPGGLDWAELTLLLKAMLASPALAGVSLGCYNPEKDQNQENGRQIVDIFTKIEPLRDDRSHGRSDLNNWAFATSRAASAKGCRRGEDLEGDYPSPHLTAPDLQGRDRLRHTISGDLWSETLGEEPGEQESCRNREEDPGPSFVNCEGQEEPLHPFDERDKCGRTDTNTHANQRSQRKKATHLTLGEHTHRRQLANGVERPAHLTQSIDGVNNPRSSSRMEAMAFRSHVTRPLDPRSPSNIAITGLTLIVTAAAGVIALTADQSLWLPILAGGATFLTWALGRELDPDHQTTALLAAIPAAVLVLLGFEVSILVTAAVLMSARLLVESTGRRPLPTDLAAMVVLASAVAFTPLGWVVGFGLGVAIYLDDRMTEVHSSRAVVAAIGAALGSSVVATLTGAFPQALPVIRPPLTLALGILALIAVVREPLDPVSLVDSRKRTPLRRDRLHLARTVVGLLAFFGALIGGESIPTVATLALTLALALGFEELERVRRRRR